MATITKNTTCCAVGRRFLEKFRFSRVFLRFSMIFRFWLLASLHLNDSLSQIIHNLKSAFWGVFDGFLRYFSLSVTSRAFFFVFLAPHGHFHGCFCDFLAYVYFFVCAKKIIYVLSQNGKNDKIRASKRTALTRPYLYFVE